MSISDSARKIPGVAAAEGELTGALATEQDLPIAGYDEQTAEDIASRLKGFTRRELRTIDAYERRRGNRATITYRVAKLLGEQPWARYDELTAAEVQTVLSEGDGDRAERFRSYERARKNRAGVLKAAEREHANA